MTFVKIGEVKIHGKTVPIYASKNTAKQQTQKIVKNVQATADAINNVSDAGTTQAEMQLNNQDKKNIGNVNQLVYVPGNIGEFIPQGIPNVTATNDDGSKKSWFDGQQDIKTGTWFSSDLKDSTPAQLSSSLAHEGFHRTEYLKSPTAWDKEASTERGPHDREVRAYKYQLDFYTRFNSMDPKRPNSDMLNLQELIDKPYTGPTKN